MTTRTIEAATPEQRQEWRDLIAEGWQFVRCATFRRDGVRVERVTLAAPAHGGEPIDVEALAKEDVS